MNRVNIYRAATNEQTTISNLFIDEYMADANDALISRTSLTIQKKMCFGR